MKKKGSNDEIIDERFLAATNRPQFRSSGGKQRNHKSKSHDGKHANNKGKDDSSGTLHSTTNFDANDGFGESLTEAMRSDDRFSEALTNEEKFGCVPGMDKYGRKIKKKKKKRRDDDDDDGADDDSSAADDDQEEQRQAAAKKKDNMPMDMESRIAYLNALSRGDISASSSDESDSSDDDDDDDSNKSDNADEDDDSSASSTNIHGKAGVFDPSYNQLPGDHYSDNETMELTTEPTPYLCILNLDWEHTRAVDVYAMLHSFCPPGTLKRVDIYPSDFGKKMMEKERLEGPSGLWKKSKKKKSNDDEEDNDTQEDEEHNNESESDDEEDILNLDEATAKLYSHFPPQSQVMKNSKLQTEEEEEEGFDHEKLRAYEASKLRYYFAIATFSSASAAEPVYEDVDGMEMEHSAAEIDVRALPVDQYDETIEGRTLHDSCDHLPGKYAPPDNVVTALRQSKVTCSWERGDTRREKVLTKWGMGKEAWDAMNEGDDIKFYLASDNSSAGEESDDDDEGDGDVETEKKSRKMRALLGLSGSEDDDEEDDDANNSSDGSNDGSDDGDAGKDAASSESESEDEAEAKTKQVTFTPGKKNLEEKIRSKLQGETAELTPFQKYLEKRKEKRRERRQAARKKGKGEESDSEEDVVEDDGMYGVDPEFGVAKFSDEESVDDADIGEADADGGNDDDGFFLEDTKSGSQKKKGKKSKGKEEDSNATKKNRMASTKEELELLIAGDDDEEDAKDFDMRGLEKLERHANKKLRGKRKRQLENLAANVSGQGFQVDTKDDRFSALLEGTDDRFGIDRTNPAFKETTAMKTLLEEQAKRRKKNRGKSKEKVSDKSKNQQSDGKDGNKNDSWVESSSGAMELSSLVKSLQTKVKSTDKPKKKKLRQQQ
ncbi:hypothetical protein ACHAWT_000892 [Skeletonema menzelii]